LYSRPYGEGSFFDFLLFKGGSLFGKAL